MLNVLKKYYGRLSFLAVLLFVPFIYFLNIFGVKNQIDNIYINLLYNYYSYKIDTNFKNYINKNQYTTLDSFSGNVDDFLTSDAIDTIKKGKCNNLLSKVESINNLYAYKIDKCFNSGDFYIFSGELLTVGYESYFYTGDTIYSIDKEHNYNIKKNIQQAILYTNNKKIYYLVPKIYKFIKNLGKRFYILSKNNRVKLYYLSNSGVYQNLLLDITDLEFDIDKVYVNNTGNIYEISFKYKNSTKGKRIIFDIQKLKKVEEKDLQYIVCNKKTQKCYDDFTDKIKELYFENIIGGKRLKGKFLTGSIKSVKVKVSGGNCIDKIYNFTGDTFTGIDYKFPIKIEGTGDCTRLKANVILKGRNKIDYEKEFEIRNYFLVKKYISNIGIFTAGQGDVYVLNYFSGDEIQQNNPYLLKELLKDKILDYSKFPKISVYKIGDKYIIGVIYSGENYGTIINLDTLNFTKQEEKVEKKYFRCDDKTGRCFNDFKEKVVSLGVKNLVDRGLVKGIFKEGTMKSGSIVLSGCINKTYQITGNLYSGVNYTFPIRLDNNIDTSKCKKIKGIINLTGTNNISYPKSFELDPPFLVDNLGNGLYKFQDNTLGYNLGLYYASGDLRKATKLVLLEKDVKIYNYISGSNYLIGLTYSGTNVGKLIYFDSKTGKRKIEKANYIVCDKQTHKCYDQFKQIVKDLVIKKDLYGGSLIGILKEGQVKNIKVQPLSGNCKLDIEPYNLKKFIPGDISFKYNFSLKYKNICKNGGKFKITLEGFNGKRYETIINVDGHFFDEKYKPEKLILINKVCKNTNEWWFSDKYNSFDGMSCTMDFCYLGYFLTKGGKVGLYLKRDSYDIALGCGDSKYIFSNIDIVGNVESIYKSDNLANFLLQDYFDLDKYKSLISYKNNVNLEKLDDTFDIINYKGYSFYKKGNQIYVKAPTQNVLLSVDINYLPCKGVFCEKITKFDWTKANDSKLIKHKQGDIVVYEKKGKYYILDNNLENGKYLMPVDIDMKIKFSLFSSCDMWGDNCFYTKKLDKTYKFVGIYKNHKFYEKDGYLYVDGGDGILRKFIVKVRYSTEDGTIKFNKKYFNHNGNYTIWPDNYDTYKVIVETNISLKDLEQIGTWVSYPVYRIKNLNNDIVKQFYCERYSEYDEGGKIVCNTNTNKYKTFFEKDPILIWKDPLGRYIIMTEIEYVPQAEKAKPVIYLYPQKEQKISVKIGLNGQFLTTIPKYNNGWDVVAKPDGTIISNLEIYPYLYRDGIDKNYIPPKKGFVIKNNEKYIKLFLETILTKVGLNKQEKKDFIEYWIPYLQKTGKRYIFIGFKFTDSLERETPLFISPKPDSLLRIFMDYYGLDNFRKVDQPIIKKFNRNGFSVVEWGGRKF